MSRLCLLLLLAYSAAQACSVPVFAYALRRWDVDPHTLTTARDAAWRQAFERRVDADALNLSVAAGEGPDRLEHRSVSGPWWSGTLDAGKEGSLIASPLRKELARRLASGQTAVWLFVPGEDVAANAAARKLLSDRLAYLKGVIELPQAQDGDESASVTLAMRGPTVRLEFSILDLDRADAAEWVLASQVQAMAKDVRGPCAVPVYGRARALDILHGETFVAAAIDDIVRFLCGACSCQVKELNPGWDLLVACDWNQAMESATEADPASQPAHAVPETVVIAPRPVQAPPAVVQDAPARVPPPWATALAILVAIGLAIRILRPQRQ